MSEYIRKEIKELAEIILEQSQKLLAYTEDAPRIEVDIVKENIRKLYDHLDSLVNTSWQVNPNVADSRIEDSIDDQVDELLNVAEAQFEEDLEQINIQISEQEEVINEQNSVIEEEVAISNDEFFDHNEEVIPLKEEAKPIITQDTNEVLIDFDKSSKNEKEDDNSTNLETSSLVDQLQKKPIASLKSAIGINDKFQFINELFDGKMKKYNVAIDQLEEAGDRNTAVNIFNTIAASNNWDEENPAFVQLFDYIHRRYS